MEHTVSTGATGTTTVLPKFSDTLTLFQPRMADSAHHCRGCTKHFPLDTSKVILLRGDATETGHVTDCLLRSDSDLGQHTQQYRPAPWQKGKQTRPVSVSSPLNNITLYTSLLSDTLVF